MDILVKVKLEQSDRTGNKDSKDQYHRSSWHKSSMYLSLVQENSSIKDKTKMFLYQRNCQGLNIQAL